MKKICPLTSFGSGLFLLAIVSLMSCGGGGGGGVGGGEVSGDGITYIGMTEQATINQSNAFDLAQGAFLGGEISGGIGTSLGVVRSIKSNHASYLDFTRIVEKAVRQVDFRTSSTHILDAGAIVSETVVIYGTCGGNADISADLDDVTGEFTGDINFTDFCSEGIIINGPSSFSGKVRMNDYELLQFSLSFTTLNVNFGDLVLTMAGSISAETSLQSDILAIDVYTRNNDVGVVYWVNNYQMTISEGMGYIEFGISGRFYDPVYGYVDVFTPIIFRMNPEQYGPSTGVLLAVGKNGTKAQFLAVNPTTFKVLADTNGDGSYDWDSGDTLW